MAEFPETKVQNQNKTKIPPPQIQSEWDKFLTPEKNNTCAQLSAFAVTAIRDCLQAVDTYFCVEPNEDNRVWL